MKRLLSQYKQFKDIPYDHCSVVLEYEDGEYVIKAYIYKNVFYLAFYKDRKNVDKALEDMFDWYNNENTNYYKFPEDE